MDDEDPVRQQKPQGLEEDARDDNQRIGSSVQCLRRIGVLLMDVDRPRYLLQYPVNKSITSSL